MNPYLSFDSKVHVLRWSAGKDEFCVKQTYIFINISHPKSPSKDNEYY